MRKRPALSWLLMLLPFLIWLTVFAYAPLVGLMVSFRDFSWNNPLGGKWVGLRNFHYLFSDSFFDDALLNTLFFAVSKSIIIVALPVLLAFALRSTGKGISYLYSSLVMVSYFSSWVVISVAVRFFVSPQTWGLALAGGSLLNQAADARWIFTFTDSLKSSGWVFFVYLLTLRGLDPAVWEVAFLEGASGPQLLRLVALPMMAPVIAVVAVLTVTGVVDSSTDQALNLSHPGIYSGVDVIGSYAYRTAIRNGHIARASAASLVESALRLAVVAVAFLAGLRFLRRAA
ncbi:MAG TPA: hypothetical protein VMV68_06180 [Spirochaetia bacterium]|nr:hypothetical protein [Spirochaetia bacterium]